MGLHTFELLLFGLAPNAAATFGPAISTAVLRPFFSGKQLVSSSYSARKSSGFMVVMPHHKQLFVGVLFLKVFPVRAWNIEELYKQTHHQPDSQRESQPAFALLQAPVLSNSELQRSLCRMIIIAGREFDSQVFEPPFYELYFNIKYHLIINSDNQTWQTIHHVFGRSHENLH
jgi:hypothetical protein